MVTQRYLFGRRSFSLSYIHTEVFLHTVFLCVEQFPLTIFYAYATDAEQFCRVCYVIIQYYYQPKIPFYVGLSLQFTVPCLVGKGSLKGQCHLFIASLWMDKKHIFIGVNFKIVIQFY